MLFITKLGPLEMPGAARGALLVFREGGLAIPPIAADDERAALVRLLVRFAGEELLCDELLGPSSRELGLRVGTLPIPILEAAALLALGVACRDSIPLGTEGSILRHLVTAANVLAAAPPSGRRDLVVDVRLQGLVTASCQARVTRSGLDAARVLLDSTPGNQLSLFLDTRPAFARSALQRGFSLGFVPRPLKVADGLEVHVQPDDLLVLSAVMRALAAMGATGREGSAKLALGSERLLATVRPTAPTRSPPPSP